MSKYFFLSYARLDRDEDKKFQCVKTFYNDLVEEVRHRTARTKEDICFFDGEDIEPGFDWPNSLSEALGTCSVFVCMYSRTYFTRPHCGREWAIFHSRLSRHAAESPAPGAVPPLILPVLLGAPDELPALPERITRIQFQHDDFPETYKREGLRYLLKLGLTSDYQLFVTMFARKLIHAAETHCLNPLEQFPDVETYASAFEEESSDRATAPQESDEVDPRVSFFFVAGTRQELAEVRDEVGAYGNKGGPDWRPYPSASPDKVALIAQGVAYNEGLISDIVPLDDDLIQRLRQSKAGKNIAALIADVWTLRLEKYAGWMRRYDEYDAYNCAMLVAADAGDPETEGKRDALDEAVREVFETKARREPPDLFLYPVNSHEKLREKLGYVLGRLKMDILREKVREQPAVAVPAMRLPTVAGPGEA